MTNKSIPSHLTDVEIEATPEDREAYRREQKPDISKLSHPWVGGIYESIQKERAMRGEKT
jgi:hypothetical protein